MGLFDKLAAKFVSDDLISDVELGMASDADAPPELLRNMARETPAVWDALLANPSTPDDAIAHIHAQRGEKSES